MPKRIIFAVTLVAACLACDSMELTVAVNQTEEGVLEVVNSNNRALKDVRLVIEAFESEGTVQRCGDATLTQWEPGQKLRFQRCADKVRFTLTAGGETARFSYFNGQLYRRIGRKEVPIAK